MAQSQAPKSRGKSRSASVPDTEVKILALLKVSIRKVWWMYSHRRRELLKEWKQFNQRCNICQRRFEQKEVHVDHNPALGYLHSLDELPDWIRRLFFGNLQIICVECHKLKTKQDLKDIAEARKRANPPKIKKAKKL